MKKGLLKYILIGIAALLVFVLGWSYIATLIHPERTFTDGLKNLYTWFLAVVFGISSAQTLWKKDQKKNGKQ